MTEPQESPRQPPLFRQSLAKVLLQECPALVKKQLDNAREKTTAAMTGGGLLDALVMGHHHKYEVVQAFYKSGPRKGEPCIDWQGAEARKEKERIQATGKLPVLQNELDELDEAAAAIKRRLGELYEQEAEGHGYKVMFQPQMRWTSALGVACRGEPDIVIRVSHPAVTRLATVDIKHSAALAREKLHRQVFAMGWDIQGAAYREAVVAEELRLSEGSGKPVQHVAHYLLLTNSMEEGLPPCCVPLSTTYLAVGLRRWEKAQRVWQSCLDTGNWTGYSESPIEPSHFVVRTELEAFDEDSFEGEEP